ncbi:hypothetical protein POX_c04172 [Penicillium oxalicum]|uniref:Uncharacterized protein n=1 Tax=Penicillium oxalicum (strain 114-2 / CGMCC 5302) TaxID=933388 RepID=S8AVC5_PENO1|nr:hypothetical protein POX_c04172 [Penicillium oxalicum]EPS25802.1 hypothetical protein PDE_00738 [Penicillium oxalicum 114-2]KAI2791315.1 hypothetical protein POX_c04172 [Penicillium oxalicum]
MKRSRQPWTWTLRIESIGISLDGNTLDGTCDHSPEGKAIRACLCKGVRRDLAFDAAHNQEGSCPPVLNGGVSVLSGSLQADEIALFFSL